MRTIKSLYTEHKFEMEILGENETEYIVRHLPEYQSKMAEGGTIHTLRKSMIQAGLYELGERHEEYRQLSMFEKL